jgi:hypothetical protein
MELRREQEKKMIDLRTNQNYLSHMGHFGDKLGSKEKGRIRSTSMKNQGNKVSGSKIQLPSLGSHFFVISTSNKAINKKL